ncbi:hypothetical protein [Guptibacillus algicola]|uniref:hypothetical protein n=1 Tax=Guptibacillus algicola TaxID=225844 RepID=UPI001CD75E85|nr:hypothetical protein [Alkalihalobacillus algicola]MCA0987419.1 hypothetical protein [Alkalihalobacillus algicola]
MMVEIVPTKEQIKSWMKEFVPKKDFFFVKEKDLPTFNHHLNEVLLIPSDEFFRHPSYRQVELSNSYTYWNISKDVDYVIAAHSSWIENLNKEKKRVILNNQIKVNRGLIMPLSYFIDETLVPEEYIFEETEGELVVIQHDMWNALPEGIRESALLEYARQWEDWSCYETPDATDNHISRYANHFSTLSGSNCLSTTLFAVTKQEWIIKEWMHPATFSNGLKIANYTLTSGKIQCGDVITWVNENNSIQHAAYYIGNDLVFNKNGQTFFNPWKIVHIDQLNEQWNQYTKKIYRKHKKTP